MHRAWASFSYVVKCFIVTIILVSAKGDTPKHPSIRPRFPNMSLSQSNTNNSSTLVVLTATSTIAVGFSIYLWHSVARLQERLDILESKQQAEEVRVSPTKRVSDSPGNDRISKTASRSLSFNPDDGVCPIPEVELGPDDPLPLRFERAGKGDLEEGRRRFVATLDWRERHEMNSILYEARPNFELIKSHYPHFYHGYGLQGEPVFYEQPPKTDLKAMRQGGVDLKSLLTHYAMVTEFAWQYLSRSDDSKSIYIIGTCIQRAW